VGTGDAGSAAEGESRYRAAIAEPYGLACDAAGNLYFSDYENNRVARVDAKSGAVSTLADVPAPQGLALDRQGRLYVGTMIGEVWEVDTASRRTTLIAGGGALRASGGHAASMALGTPAGVAVGPDQALYIADASLHVVYRMELSSGHLEVIAGQRDLPGFDGDGSIATEARLNGPSAVAIDSSGNVYIADADNHVIRLITVKDGLISTVAGKPVEPGFAGDGPATETRFNWPQDLQWSGPHSLLIADTQSDRVRELDLQAGVIRTVSGTGAREFREENVIGMDAALPTPVGIAIGPDRSVYVSSPRAQRIFRLGAPSRAPKPWWKSPWAWLGILLVLGAMLYTAAELRARQLRRRSLALQEEVGARTRALVVRQADVARRAERLHQLAATRQELLNQVSADFQEPLLAMLQSLQVIRGSPIARERYQYVDTVERNAHRLLRLVDHMQRLAGTNGPVEEEIGPVAPGPIIAQLLQSFEPVATEHGVVIAAGEVESIVVRSTSEAVESIGVNLISNAIKYTPSGGSVSVELKADAGMGVIIVADTGRGIAPGDLERVFEPFERVHDEGERIPGSGLGLAIVREQALAHGGRVEAQSEPGRGSRFRVYLPLAAQSEVSRISADRADRAHADRTQQEIGAMRRPGDSPVAGNQATDSPTVLVVEDNSDMRRYVVEVLSAQYRCVEAENGQAAVVAAIREVPDVVVCDVMLPIQDGFAVCRELRSEERTSHIPIVLLTALEDVEHRSAGLAELADVYLAKPFSEQELLLRIRNLLDLRALLQRRFSRDLRFERHLPEGLGDRDRRFLGRLGQLLDASFADLNFDGPAMAAALAVSERQLQRKLRALIGLAPSEFLRDYRLQRAHDRLTDGVRAGEVAAASGFSSHAHFSACFRARFGYKPSDVQPGIRRIGSAAPPEVTGP
jgi:signal transduction histidine kinase/CheY-like chemotaxis protein/sugar lactone lactonase YvrE